MLMPLSPPSICRLIDELLGPADDVLDHGARGEVLEVQDLLVAVLVGDLEEAVGVVDRVHAVDRGHDHRLDRLLGTAVLGGLGVGDREVGREVLGEDLGRARLVGALDLDLHVEAARAAGWRGR